MGTLADKTARSDTMRMRPSAAAQVIASKPAGSMRHTKKLMRDREALMARMQQEGEIFAERLRSPEAAAAFAAFLTKR